MLEPMQASGIRICLLVLTYKRNEALRRVVGQCQELMQSYRGRNTYELCVADSDPDNAIVLDPEVRYSRNPGQGFDDNLYHFWQQNVDRYEYIFTISDDDLFLSWLNPLYLLDGAAHSGAEVVMFNHRDYRLKFEGSVALGNVYYADADLTIHQTRLLRNILTQLPRHIATLYSTVLLKETLPKIALFRGTLHLYAAPVVFAAARRTMLYSDYTLCLFHAIDKSDGAWAVGDDIVNGLAAFLGLLKQILPPDLYEIAEAGFFNNFLGSSSVLRKIIRPGPSVKSEREIRETLTHIQ